MKNSKKRANTPQATMTENITQTPQSNQTSRSISMNAIMDIKDYEIFGDAIKNEFPFMQFAITDDSMEPRISKGDSIITRIQDTVSDGEVAVIYINNQITCRKFKKTIDGIMLIPTNPKYNTIFYSNKDIKRLQILKVIGVVKEVRSTY